MSKPSLDVYQEYVKPDPQYLKAALDVILVNGLIWAIDRHVMQFDYSMINLSTIKENLQKGFLYDDDGFYMNQLLHPFHGSLNFNAARSEGVDYWFCIPYTFAGSLLWELFLEAERPSTNDLITTTMGGTLLGETSHRVTSLLLNSKAKGVEKGFQELVAGIINPVQALKRLFGSKRTRKNFVDYQLPYAGAITIGGDTIGPEHVLVNADYAALIGFEFVYGTPFLKRDREPMDYFNLSFECYVSEDRFAGSFLECGLLLGKNIKFLGNEDNLVGIFQHFDFIANEVYKISASCVGGGVVTRFRFSEKIHLGVSVHLAPIIFGGSNSVYAEEVGRDYNLGSGLKENYKVSFDIAGFCHIYSGVSNYWIHTVNGAEGNENIDIINSGISIPVLKHTNLGIEYLDYSRRAVYKQYPYVYKNNNAVKIFMTYSF
jgi:hypothetical protein